jgi:hypothetical protein
MTIFEKPDLFLQLKMLNWYLPFTTIIYIYFPFSISQ